MRVLVTNDDGWSAPGLATLVAETAAAGHEVYVVAPSVERSGSGTALGRLDDGFEFAAVRVEVPGAVQAWSLDAPPAMCVIAALSEAIGVRPSVVLSGINAGHNTGRNIAHSGTFGAAWMAARYGLPAAAISAGPLPGARFDTAASVMVGMIDELASIEPGFVLNVNVPDLDLGALGPRVAVPLAKAGMQRIGLSLVDGHVQVSEMPPVRSEGDTGAVLDGCVSVSLVESRLHLGAVPTSLLAPAARPTGAICTTSQEAIG